MNLYSELRFAVQLISLNKGFSLLCMLVIGIGLAVVLVMSTITRNFYMQSLPYANGDRYVAIFGIETRQDGFKARLQDAFDSRTFRILQERSSAFSILTPVILSHEVTLSDSGAAVLARGSRVEPGLLQHIDARPQLGRLFESSDALANASNVALISDALWQSYFGAEDDIVGQQVWIDGEPTTIIGVMEPGFSFPTSHELWLPYQPPPPGSDTEKLITPIAVLREGTSIEQANLEIEQIVEHLKRSYPAEYEDFGAIALPYTRLILPNDSPLPVLMTLVSFLVGLLAILNVSNLMIVRVGERTQELAIRTALGADRRHVWVHSLAETFLLALGGMMLGLVLTLIGNQWVAQEVSIANVPFWMSFGINLPTLAIATAATFVIWLVAGGSAAIRASRVDTIETLVGGAPGVLKKNSNRFSNIVVSFEIILSVLLLVLSGSLIAAMSALGKTDYGTATEPYLTAKIDLPQSGFEDYDQRLQFFEELKERIEQLPFVQGVGLASALPSVVPSIEAEYLLPDRTNEAELEKLNLIPISHNYLSLLKVEVKQGREFEQTDHRKAENVAIIDEQFANKLWPGQSALGKVVEISSAETKHLRIVGVISPIRQSPAFISKGSSNSLYVPMSQLNPEEMQIVVRVDDHPAQRQTAIVNAAAQLDQTVALSFIYPLDELLALGAAPLRLLADIFMIVSVIAIVLAATGIYALVSRSVVSRTHEMGIRRSLGLTEAGVVRLFMWQGAKHLLIGISVGGGLGILLSRAAATMFPEIMDTLSVTFILVGMLMAVIVCLASAIPALRVTRIEPGDSLRHTG